MPKEETQPEEIVMRRGGGGYGTEADAQAAVASKQTARPDLDWRVEPMENGRLRIAGYTIEASDKATEPANATPQATTSNPIEIAATPTSIWTGRSGGGYATVEAAQAQIRARQSAGPSLQWKAEQLPNGPRTCQTRVVPQ